MGRCTMMYLISLTCLLALLVTPAFGATVTVHVFNFNFSTNPAGQPIQEATINVGDTVEWVWDQGTHTTTSVVGSIETWDSGAQSMGATFSHTFTHAGVITYYCKIHGTDLGNGMASGMHGTITVVSPGPSITSLMPSSATAGGAGFTLTVNGSNFQSGDTVNWTNGTTTSLTTTFVSANQLTATVPASLIANAGTASITDVQGSQTSNAATFSINNPAPTLSKIAPASADAGGPAFTLTVTGTNFINGSVVNWKVGATTTALSTTFVSSTKLTASVTSTLIASAGKASVTVVNPTPGGGTSAAKTFTILQTTLSAASASLVKNSDGSFTATITLNNVGFMTASNVTIKSSTLGAAKTSTTLPVNIGNINADSGGTVMLTYPSTAGTSGSKVTLKVSGTFTGGSFSGSLKVTLP